MFMKKSHREKILSSISESARFHKVTLERKRPKWNRGCYLPSAWEKGESV